MKNTQMNHYFCLGQMAKVLNTICIKWLCIFCWNKRAIALKNEDVKWSIMKCHELNGLWQWKIRALTSCNTSALWLYCLKGLLPSCPLAIKIHTVGPNMVSHISPVALLALSPLALPSPRPCMWPMMLQAGTMITPVNLIWKIQWVFLAELLHDKS